MSASSSYLERYYLSPECLATFEKYRSTVVKQIGMVTTIRYEAHWKRRSAAVIQAWRDLKLEPPLPVPEDVHPQVISADRTTHEQRYAILKNTTTFRAFGGVGHGKTKERLERFLWVGLPQLCDATGKINCGSGSDRHEGSEPCDWWISRSTHGLEGILYINYKKTELIRRCEKDFGEIYAKHMVAGLIWDWAKLKNSLKGLTPLDEGEKRYEELLEQCESGTEAGRSIADTQETGVDIPGHSVPVAPTLSQMVEFSVAGSNARKSL